ncbi:hypothetical protein HDR59_05555 [bacterium]|nr:hypothetical protein [bacterium]
MKEGVLFLVGLLLAFLFVWYVLLYPIRLAESKKIKGNDLTLIKILTWFGFLAGITWLIALFYTIAYKKHK